MMTFGKGQHHQARVAGRREKRQEGNIRQSTGVHKYEKQCVSKHFMSTLKCMLSLNHCSGTDWIYTLTKIPHIVYYWTFLAQNRDGQK